MTKQRPYATKRRLSRLFRAILILGALKISILAAIAMDVPIPTISFDFGGGESKAPVAADAALRQKVSPPAETRVSGVWMAPASNVEAKDDVKSIPVAEMKPEPQGQAAIEAAKAYRNTESAKPEPDAALMERPLAAFLEKDKEEIKEKAPARVLVPAEASIGGLFAASGVDFSRDPVQGMAPATVMAAIPVDSKEDEKSGQWWKNLLGVTKLPIPRFGSEQVAHAASLDMPPAPSVKSSSNPSPFLPPSEQMPVIPNAQDSEGRVLPLRNQKQADGSNAPGAPAATATRPAAPQGAGGSAGFGNSNILRQQEDLARREQEVLMLKQQMDMRLNDLRDAEKKVQDMLKDAKSAEDAKYKSLINMYRNMKPKQAAQALGSMEERVAVRILSGMSPKEAGEILSYSDPKKTAKLSELITRMNTGH